MLWLPYDIYFMIVFFDAYVYVNTASKVAPLIFLLQNKTSTAARACSKVQTGYISVTNSKSVTTWNRRGWCSH